MGSYYITQRAQPGTLSQPRGVGWEGGGRFIREGIYIYIYTIMADLRCCTAETL